MADSFADAPVTLGEIRSEKSRDAADWTPRDMLVSMLRDIDNGKIDPDQAVIILRENGDDNGPAVRYWIAGLSSDPDDKTASFLGLLEKVEAIVKARWLGLIP